MLLSIAKLQNLKAIHNRMGQHLTKLNVVINRKTTKFESNSQRYWWMVFCCISCYQSQNYKIWKQFTTACSSFSTLHKLLSIAKLQNLKAIHNIYQTHHRALQVVINRKTTKFESNSQQNLPYLCTIKCCYQSQNYKIWKQFTTLICWINLSFLLLSIAKLQNLKAIHNSNSFYYILLPVVINRKTTKFESNSQQYLYHLHRV